VGIACYASLCCRAIPAAPAQVKGWRRFVPCLLEYDAVGDLYVDDITDEAAYPSAAMLKDLRSLIANGQREGQVIDYKADVSPKDNWPETVAAC
jgi:hypothetical protein